MLLIISAQFLCVNVFRSLEFQPRNEILFNYMASMFWDLPTHFPKWLDHFTVLPAMLEGSNLSKILSIFTIILIIVNLTGQQYFSMVLICISLITNSCVYWPSAYVEKCLPTPLFFLNCSSLCILDTCTLFDTWLQTSISDSIHCFLSNFLPNLEI